MILRLCKRHGEHSNWKIKNKQNKSHEHICRLCIQHQRKQKRILCNYNKILNRYGKEYAELYLNKYKNTHFNVFLSIIRRKTIKLSNNSPKHVVNRVEILNGTLNVSSGEWFCQHCGIKNSNHSFFEIDRIIPGKDGGNYEIGNIQILCPNCHKCKTHSLTNWVDKES